MNAERLVRCAVLCTLAAAAPLAAQDLVCSIGGPVHAAGDELPSYTLRELSPNDVAKLRVDLKAQKWPDAIRLYLSNYQPALPTWIVYIDEDGNVSQCVVADNRAGPIVRGKRIIWGMIFSDLPLGPDQAMAKAAYQAASDSAHLADVRDRTRMRDALDSSRIEQMAFRDLAKARVVADPQNTSKRDTLARAAAQAGDATSKWASADSALNVARLPSKAANPLGDDTLDLRFYRRTIMRQPDQVIIGLIKGFAKNFGLDVPTTPASPVDSVRALNVRQISSNPKEKSMWVALGRIGLEENGVFELSVGPYPGRDLPGFANKFPPLPASRVYTNVADVREHTWELGLLNGITFGRSVPTYDANLHLTGHSSPTDFSSYVTVFANLPSYSAWFQAPWRQAWQRSSVGIFAGTNINGTIGDQLVAGLSIGHFIGDAGVSFGTAWVPTSVVRNGALGSSRLARLFTGIDLRL